MVTQVTKRVKYATEVFILLSDMSFWKKVCYELEFQNLSRKELAYKIDVPVATINRAIERNSNPYAIDALRIAKVLGVSLEYLLEIPQPQSDKASFVQTENQQIELFKKYHEVIHVLESLPLEKQKLVLKIVEQCGELGREG